MTASPDARPVLIAYDGSDNARIAVRRAAELFAGRPAVVAVVWASLADVASAGLAALPASIAREGQAKLDAEAEQNARALAEEAVAIARENGLDAEPVTVGTSGNVAEALLRTASERDAVAVVVGTRGRSAVRSALLGSVSNHVVHAARCPVVVVPNRE